MNVELLQSSELNNEDKLVLKELGSLNDNLSVLAGSKKEFPKEFIDKFYEKSKQIYIRNGFTKPGISLKEWEHTPKNTKSHYIMIIDKQREVVGGVKLIQDISNEDYQQTLSTNIKTFPVHNEVTGYDYYDKIPFLISNNEVIEISRLFVDINKNNIAEKGIVSPSEEIIIGLCLYVKQNLPQIRGTIGVIEKRLALRLIQYMEHLSQEQISSIYTFPDSHPTKEILESDHSPYFTANIGTPFFIDTHKYIDRILSHY